MLTSLSDCDSEWGEDNERLWEKHASQLSAVVAELGLDSSVELLAHRHAPFLVELCIEQPTTVSRSKAAELSQRLRQYLQQADSDWQVKVLIIPSISSTLPEGIWLEIDRFWIVERLALHSAEHFESLEDFVSTYWTSSK
jgi:hypothetical protein